jgi:hypothetical protein
VITGYEFELVGFAPDGALIATDGTRVTTRNLSLAYSVTSYKNESGTWDAGVVSFDENSIRFADRPFSYVSGTRFRQKMTVVVPDKQALAAIQNRSGERKSATSLIEQVIDRMKEALAKQWAISIREPAEREDLQIEIANEGMCLNQHDDGMLEIWICDGYDPESEDLGSRFSGLVFSSVEAAYGYVFGSGHLARARPLWAR